MAIIHNVFDKNPADNIIKSLGNMIVSGVENDGKRALYKDTIKELTKKKQTFLLINGHITKEEHFKLIEFLRPFMIGRYAYDFNYEPTSDSVDIFSAFTTIDEKVDFIVLALDSVCKMSEEVKNKAQRYFFYAIDMLERMGKSYKFKDVLRLDNEYIAEKIRVSTLDDFEKNRRNRFLMDASMYSIFLNIETGLMQLENYGIVDKLSGTALLKDVFSKGNVVLINVFTTDDFKKREILLNLLTYSFGKALEFTKKSSELSIILKEADFICGDYVKMIFDYNQTYNFATYMFVEDISSYISKMGNDILDKTKSFIVFTQGSDNNAVFWSSFFGNRDVNERSFSYTKKKSWNPFATMWDSGGVVESSRKYNTATTSFQKTNKPIYRPEVFRELRPNETMCYLREPLMRRKVRIEGV